MPVKSGFFPIAIQASVAGSGRLTTIFRGFLCGFEEGQAPRQLSATPAFLVSLSCCRQRLILGEDRVGDVMPGAQ